MDKPIYLVTGANGQLGKCLQDLSTAYPSIDFIFLGRDEMPIDNFELSTRIIQEVHPAVVINAAAYTAVDKAQTETETAYLMNGEAVGNLAAACNSIGAKFLHVSTDYVFNGEGTRPYLETDAVDPVNAYGASKLKGEELAMAANPATIVIRTSWVYCRHGNNFVKTMLRLMKDRPSINVAADQIGCPTYAVDLAEALISIAGLDTDKAGIYHFSNSGPISWFDFAISIKELSGYDCQVNPIPTSAYPTPARRPQYSVMDNHKIEHDFGIIQKHWKESLKECIRLLTDDR